MAQRVSDNRRILFLAGNNRFFHAVMGKVALSMLHCITMEEIGRERNGAHWLVSVV